MFDDLPENPYGLDRTTVIDCVDEFAEAIIARGYQAALNLCSQKLQEETSATDLGTMIEGRCQTMAAQHGHHGTHHPIDFVVVQRNLALERLGWELTHPALFTFEHGFLEGVVIEFYPSVNLNFDLFFELCLVLVEAQGRCRIAHLEFVRHGPSLPTQRQRPNSRRPS